MKAVISTLKSLWPGHQRSETYNTLDHNHQVNTVERRALENLPPGIPLSLVLLGKTGHGKSATGNSIFEENKFESHMSSTSVTQKCKMEHGVIGGREIFLVDTPGTMDTNDPDSALLEISHAITFRPDGFHAFLIVLNPTVKMTNEEKMAVILLKQMFGEHILRKYAILLFTHGDDFFRQMQAAKKKKSFMDYVKSQSGDFGALVNECNFRCVLMNNMETDPEKRRQEVIELIKEIDKMIFENGGRVYTNHLFEFARARIDEEMKRYQDIFEETSSELNVPEELEKANTNQETENVKKGMNERKVDDCE
ncbi:hypothetical protein CHS0354_028921 [Potamilus streckersoni]|uniref:AIG1-type G domain-containing protein n=1 Tax=Potamilus streckersoni TaxID=2493646 RepID=A0AAE0VXM5_9BIVA|nr:hypothetical protein CHS0354_028921 [Potamilus streckersoni]